MDKGAALFLMIMLFMGVVALIVGLSWISAKVTLWIYGNWGFNGVWIGFIISSLIHGARIQLRRK